jgi:hypothetical protein
MTLSGANRMRPAAMGQTAGSQNERLSARSRAIVSSKWGKSVAQCFSESPKRTKPMLTRRWFSFGGRSLLRYRRRLQRAGRDQLSSSVGRRWSRGLTLQSVEAPEVLDEATSCEGVCNICKVVIFRSNLHGSDHRQLLLLYLDLIDSRFSVGNKVHVRSGNRPKDILVEKGKTRLVRRISRDGDNPTAAPISRRRIGQCSGIGLPSPSKACPRGCSASGWR